MNFLRFKWSLSLIACWFIISVAYGAERELLVVGEEFAPFEFERNDEVVGIDIDIATHIFKKMNIPITFKILPWKRAWRMVETGKTDAVLSTSRKKNREPYLWYPKENMWISEFVFFVRKDKFQPNFKGYETAIQQKLKVGIINGNSYHPSFWTAFPYQDGSTTFQGPSIGLNEYLDGGNNLKINLKKLANGRIDIYPADKVFGRYTTKLLGLQNKLTYYDTVLYSKPYPMPFAKKSNYPNIKRIADRFDRALSALKQSGKYQSFFDKWLK